MIRVRRIDPQAVIISVDSGDDILNPGSAAVFGIEHVRGALPDSLIVARIDANLAVVHRPRINIAHLLPRRAAIFRSKYPAFRILDNGIDDVRIPAINVEAYPAGVAFRKIFCKPAPRSAAVDRSVEPAAGPAPIEAPRRAPALIRRRIEGSRTPRIHCDIDHAGVLIDEQRLRPGLACVSRFIDSTLTIG